MSHPVYPTFPVSPTIGDTYTQHDATWTFSSIGWVKTVIELNDDYPIWPGKIVTVSNHGGGGGGG